MSAASLTVPASKVREPGKTSPDPAFEKKMAKAEEIADRYRNTLHALSKLKTAE